MHVAQKCAAVLGQRHASKQRLKARRLNPLCATRFTPHPAERTCASDATGGVFFDDFTTKSSAQLNPEIIAK
ncbi:hypothetical protein RFM99_10020 [Mesorhizobium sp. VK4C]|uniref:hypothetical protein n=1 Tax=Mesorhizobium captivum TaxID=3072319 RepID=UPI002A2465F4|nr:hypothetical protein [Mesorhizobium sp. VK4C]MDX8498758.1 hypothetical protein [Mesorhizobium sp. VK4C]